MPINLVTGGYALGVVNIQGLSGSDNLTGNVYANIIEGGSGNDTITGGQGSDFLYGGDDNDSFVATGDWNDPAYNQVNGFTSRYLDDNYFGGSGFDRLTTFSQNLTVVLDGSARLVNDSIEAIFADPTIANFRISGTATANIFDFTNFQLTNVLIDGNNGNDTITGSSASSGYSGNDRLEGGYGIDTLVMSGSFADYQGRFSVETTPGQQSVLVIDGRFNALRSTGIDRVSGFETLQFSDQSLAIAPGAVSDSDAAANSISENAAGGSTVGIDLASTANATFASLIGSSGAQPGFRFAQGGNPQGIFAINPATGVVTVANAALLDYETAPFLSDGVTRGYTIHVEAFAAGTVSVPLTLQIAVIDGNDAPAAPQDNDNTINAVDENAANGTYVGVTVQATDPNGNAVTYSLVDNAGGRFAVNATTGAVSVANGTLLDFETQASWTIRARASDGTLQSESTFTINLNDVYADNWAGTSAADVFSAGAGKWVLDGGAGNDVLTGNSDADTIRGGADNDVIAGAGGGDWLDGGSGNDRIDGGAGNDTVVYDQADTAAFIIGGTGTDTLLVLNQAAPVAFSLAANGFEQARVERTGTAGTTNWQSIVEAYNSAWQLNSSLTVNFDGSQRSELFDLDQTNPGWKSIDTYSTIFQGQLRIYTQNIVRDNNTRDYYTFDYNPATLEESTHETFNAAGQRTMARTYNQDGSYRIFWFDPANTEVWTQIETFTATGVRQTLRQNNDDGTSIYEFVDVFNQYNYQSSYDRFDALGRRIENVTVFDQTQGGNSIRTFYDYGIGPNEPNWSVSTNYYNAAGNITRLTHVLDSGAYTDQFWDRDNSQTYSTLTDYYNASGQRHERIIQNDDLTSTRIWWDVSNAHSWSVRTEAYNVAGVMTSQVFTPD